MRQIRDRVCLICGVQFEQAAIGRPKKLCSTCLARYESHGHYLRTQAKKKNRVDGLVR